MNCFLHHTRGLALAVPDWRRPRRHGLGGKHAFCPEGQGLPRFLAGGFQRPVGYQALSALLRGRQDSAVPFPSLLENLSVPGKRKKLSGICSTPMATEAQRRRIRFVQRLKDTLGDDLDVFGRGFRSVSGKAEAIAPTNTILC